jgi:Kef-type K+ transport system membrane component KefB
MSSPGIIGYHPSPTINLLLVMVLIWTTGVIFRRIHQPAILGELLGGIIFGPCLLGIIQPDETLNVLSELGIFFIMFYAGLETNLYDLKRATRKSIYIGMGGFILPMAMGYAVSRYIIGFSLIQSVFIGLGLAITAIAVNARILFDMNLRRYRITPVILGASVVDDILSLAVLSGLICCVTMDTLVIGNLSLTVIKVMAFFAVTILLGTKVFPRFSGYFSSREAKGFTFSLILALIFGLIAELAGLHIILGAYFAGTFIRNSIKDVDLFQKITDRFVSITYGFLGPIFFVSLSFHMTFDIFRTHLFFTILLLLVAVAGKIIGCGLGAIFMRMTAVESSVIGLSMNGRGAVELIIASVGLKLGLIDDTIFSILIVIAFITTLMSPLSLSMLLKRVGTRGLKLCSDDALESMGA